LIIVGGMVASGIAKVRATADRIKCANNLHQIGISIHGWHDACGSFPPAAKANPNLSLEHRLSWLYEAIPYFEAGNFYGKFNPEKGWDSDENRFAALTGYFPECLAIPDLPPTSKFVPTHYLGITGLGENAALLQVDDAKAGFFGYERKCRMSAIKDGTSKTLAVVESAWPSGAWTAAVDSVRGVDPTGSPYLGIPGQFGGNHPGGTNVLLADASVRFLQSSLDPHVFEAMATIAGHEEINESDWNPR
jgi:prepilin-type processing-associated H-X9-DG protein